MDEVKQQSGTPKLNEALAKAQLVMTAAKKDAVNPHFKSSYADLASIIEACRKPLAENGLAIAQVVTTDAKGVTVTTRLLHVSGECIEAPCWMPVAQQTPQAYGSAITYGRRYSLAAMVGVAAEDDDGNASSISKNVPPPAGVEKLRQQVSKPVQAQFGEPPPHTDDDAPYAPADAKQRTHEDITMGKFGNGAGKRLSELDDNSVSFYRSACQRTLSDASKSQYHAKEILRLAAFNSELRLRGLPE